MHAGKERPENANAPEGTGALAGRRGCPIWDGYRYVSAAAVTRKPVLLATTSWTLGHPVDPRQAIGANYPLFGGSVRRSSSWKRRNTVADSSALTAQTMIVAPTADQNEPMRKSLTIQLVT